MSFSGPKFRAIGVVVGIAILVAAVVLLRHDPVSKGPAAKGVGTNKQSSAQSQTITSASKDFYYTQPVSWYQLPQSALDNAAAVSGIGHGTSPDVFFYISTDDSSNRPTNLSQLKTVPLETIKKLSGFKLLSSQTVKIDGQTGQQFIYLSGSSPVIKSSLTVVINKNKVYLLLFTGSADKFDTNQPTFGNILASFKFS